MKTIFSICVIILLSLTGIAQDAVYIKYETNIEADGEDGEMMAMMMNGSTMEVASNSAITWVKTEMGTMMSMEMQMDTDKEEMTFYMSGMMGEMAFEGNPDELNQEDDVSEPDVDIELMDETKDILNVTCKKAVITDENGNIATYWYTEEFKRPEGMEQMPNQIPGMCLQFEVSSEGMKMIYTAIELNDKADMDDYSINIPEGVEVKTLEEMANMGMGGM